MYGVSEFWNEPKSSETDKNVRNWFLLLCTITELYNDIGVLQEIFADHQHDSGTLNELFN